MEPYQMKILPTHTKESPFCPLITLKIEYLKVYYLDTPGTKDECTPYVGKCVTVVVLQRHLDLFGSQAIFRAAIGQVWRGRAAGGQLRPGE